MIGYVKMIKVYRSVVVNLKDGKGKAQDTEIGDSEQPPGYLWKTKGWNLEKGPRNFCFM